jgi:hypothetical protein
MQQRAAATAPVVTTMIASHIQPRRTLRSHRRTIRNPRRGVVSRPRCGQQAADGVEAEAPRHLESVPSGTRTSTVADCSLLAQQKTVTAAPFLSRPGPGGSVGRSDASSFRHASCISPHPEADLRRAASSTRGSPAGRDTLSRLWMAHIAPRAGQGVSSDLDRVRQAARRDKDVRFTALLHRVTVDRLREAYRAIRPGAAPGSAMLGAHVREDADVIGRRSFPGFLPLARPSTRSASRRRWRSVRSTASS